MPDRPFVIASNRGPLSFRRDEQGELTATRGAGGLVSGLAPLVTGTDAMWLAAAMSDDDRVAAAGGVTEAEGLRVRLVDIEPTTYRMFYDVICNATLWFCLHGLFDLARRPRIDTHWHEAWEAYRDVNATFADAITESAPEDAAVLVQDYHLALVGPLLRIARPDLRTVFFAHTPFCYPDGLRPLPVEAARAFVGGIAGNHAVSFHTARWGAAFAACADELGVGERGVPAVTPLAADAEDLDVVASSDACATARDALDRLVGDRKLLLRVDRIELSKNVLRGFHAFDDLLERHPSWRERVVFAALLYPSREGLAEYLAYRQECEGLVARLNEKWATPEWTPIVFDADDDYPRSIAALQRADVLLVNPIRDGLNLVAKEAALTSRREVQVVLSTEAGVWAELGEQGAIGVNPFDVTATADALALALSMDPDERAARFRTLHRAASARSPRDWLDDQLRIAQ